MPLEAVLLLALAVVASPPPPGAGPESMDETCPQPRITTPRYPAEMMRKGIGGQALVNIRIDDCGRVLENRIAISSRREPLDQAALAATSNWILPAEMRSRAVDGWVRAPVSFGGPIRTVAPQAIRWPKSHRNPVYLADESPLGAESAQAAKDALRGTTWLQPAYPKLNQGFHLAQESGPREYWLFLHSPLDRSQARREPAASRLLAAVRYRLHDDEPQIVRTAFVCDGSAEECAAVRELVAAGLPFAKPAP